MSKRDVQLTNLHVIYTKKVHASIQSHVILQQFKATESATSTQALCGGLSVENKCGEPQLE